MRVIAAAQVSHLSASLFVLLCQHNVSKLPLRRYKTWQTAYETIMLKYMDLCVQLQQHRQAKDGLHQYRNMAQQQAPGSLEVQRWRGVGQMSGVQMSSSVSFSDPNMAPL